MERTDSFEYNFTRLKEWIDKNNKYPYYTSVDPIESQLGTWVMYRRRDKKINRLHMEYIAKLETLPNFKWITVYEFDDMYENIKKWIETNHKYPSHVSTDAFEAKMARWIQMKRQDRKKGKLTDDNIKEMDNLPNFKWTTVLNFDETLNKLNEFTQMHNRIPSEKSKIEAERKLGEWCCRKRQEQRQNRMDLGEMKLFENNKFWYWEKEDPFDDKYKELIKWINANKKFPNRKSNDSTEKMLGYFVRWNQKKYNQNKLTKDKIDKLELINDWTWPNRGKNKTFNEKHNIIKIWITSNNRLPLKSNDDNEKYVKKLYGEFLRDHIKGKLSNDEIKLLETIPLWNWNSEYTSDLFDQKFEEFKKWTIDHKRMPSKHTNDSYEKTLKCWYHRQVNMHAKGKLSQIEFDKFETLEHHQIHKK